MSEQDEVLAKSKKPVVFPSHRGTSNGVNIPREILEQMNVSRGKQILVRVVAKRGQDGRPYIIIEKVTDP